MAFDIYGNGGFDPLADLPDNPNNDAIRFASYRIYEQYYNGKHVPQLPDDRPLPQLRRYTRFRNNFCKVIVNSYAERLIVNGFSANNDEDGSIARHIEQLWQSSKLDSIAQTVHNRSVLFGISFLTVAYDNNEDCVTFTYNDPSTISIQYEDTSYQNVISISKQWSDSENNWQRKNVYYPDKIVRYYMPVNPNNVAIAQNVDWLEFTADGQPAVIDWTFNGKPLGIAIVPFKHMAYGAPYGRSELMDIIPVQDLINKTATDLSLVLDTQGWPQRWVRSASQPAGGWNVGPGRVWVSADKNFEAGELHQAEPAGLLASLEMFINVAAGMSRTPQHLFHISGNYPSGESLKIAETGLVQKIRTTMVAFGDSWETAMKLALQLENAFGSGNWQLKNLILQTKWKEPETRLDLHYAQAVSTAAPWLSHEEILRKLGYNQSEITQILAEFEANKNAEAETTANTLDAFARGQDIAGNGLPGDPGMKPPGQSDLQNRPGGQATVRN